MSPLSGNGRLLLYLDFDGVLHHENCLWHHHVGPYLSAPEEFKLFQHVPLLERLLEPYPQVGLILSTSWVRRYGCTKTAKNLGHKLRHRVLGATFHSRMNEEIFMDLPRGKQVLADVQRRQPRDWLALDDNPEGWPPESAGKFIQTHAHLGISAPTVQATLEQKLKEMCK